MPRIAFAALLDHHDDKGNQSAHRVIKVQNAARAHFDHLESTQPPLCVLQLLLSERENMSAVY